MIVITLQQFFVLLWIFCITKVILHGFRINIIGISINRYFYEYNVDDKNAIKEYHRGRAVRSIIILILDSITLVISYKYSIEMATGFMIISTIASIIIKYIKDKERTNRSLFIFSTTLEYFTLNVLNIRLE